MARLFGTDGVRGIANKDLTCDLAYRIARAASTLLCGDNEHGRILIGRDPRRSGNMLEAAMTAGFCESGISVVLAGVIPTPGVAYLTQHMGMDAGVMISASHNSAEYNGVKLFSASGRKLPDATEDAIEARLSDEPESVEAAAIGRVTQLENAASVYTAHLLSTVEEKMKRMRIVLDCANGAASHIAPVLFRSLGMEAKVISAEPDGDNINRACGSTNVHALQAAVVAMGADCGFAFDGDADRLIAVDEKGNMVDGNAIIYLCALHMHRQGRLANNAVAGTVMSNMGLELSLQRSGISVIRANVGDRYVMEAIEQHRLSLGGEPSGHIVFADDATTGDGMLTAIKMLTVLSSSGQPLSQLAGSMLRTPQYQCSAAVEQALHEDVMRNRQVQEAIEQLERSYHGKGRLLVRPSGTEPAIRIMTEHTDAETAQADAMALKQMIEHAVKE